MTRRETLGRQQASILAKQVALLRDSWNARKSYNHEIEWLAVVGAHIKHLCVLSDNQVISLEG